MNCLSVAKRLAEQYHRALYGDQPYFSHLKEVVDSVSNAGYGDEYKIVGYLHDILEDTHCTVAILSAYLTDDILDAVKAITKLPGQSYEDYIAIVRANKIALVVKIHDTMCNLKHSFDDYDERRVRKYSKQLWLLTEKK